MDNEDDLIGELDKILEDLRKDPYGAIDSTNAKKVRYKFKQMEPTYYKNYDYSPKKQNVSEQINALWQEVKKLQNTVADQRTTIVNLNVKITELNNKINDLTNPNESDKIVELNDRIDDLESRIDLLDE